MQAQKLPMDMVEEQDDFIDLGLLWRAVRRHWMGIAGLCFAVSMIAVLMVMRQAPIYQATTSIMITLTSSS